jgi:hypothetical protein
MNNRDDVTCNDVIALCDDENNIDDVIESIQHYSQSMTSHVVQYLKTFASFDTTNNECITYDVEKFHIVRAFTLLIANEYDNFNKNDDMQLWNTFALSGDDDVDYNSSYIELLCEFIELYEKNNVAKIDETTK